MKYTVHDQVTKMAGKPACLLDASHTTVHKGEHNVPEQKRRAAGLCFPGSQAETQARSSVRLLALCNRD